MSFHKAQRVCLTLLAAVATAAGCGGETPPADVPGELPAEAREPAAAATDGGDAAADPVMAFIYGEIPLSEAGPERAFAAWLAYAADAEQALGNVEAIALGERLAAPEAGFQPRMLEILADPEAPPHQKLYVTESIKNRLDPGLIDDVVALTAPEREQFTRRFGAELLAQSANPESEDALRSLAEDPDHIVALASRLGLAAQGDQEALEVLAAQYAAAGTDSRIRDRILHTMVSRPAPEGLPVLHAALLDEALPTVQRVNVVAALVNLGDPSSVEALDTCAEAATDPELGALAESAAEAIRAATAENGAASP